MSIIKRRFKLYNNRPSQRIDEMSANDLQLLKTKASSMANACGFADDGKGQNFWIGVECNCEERLKELGASTCEYCKNENLIFQNNKEASMSELKVASCFEFEKVLSGKSNKLFYSKSEADKVIAELKKEKQYAVDNVAEVINGQERELSHQKYKRCLAMARWCASRVVVWATEGNEKKSDWYWKWKEKWRELAEKFKPNSTAQQG